MPVESPNAGRAAASGGLPPEASAGLAPGLSADPAVDLEGHVPDEELRGWFDRLLGIMGGIAGVIIAFIMLSVAAEVTMRYFFNRPLGWTTEISEVGLLYVSFLSAAWILRKDAHIKVDLLAHVLPPKGRALFGILTSLLGAVACAIVVVYGVQVTWALYERAAHTPTLLRLPQAPIIGVIPFGSFFLTIEFLRRALRFRRTLRES